MRIHAHRDLRRLPRYLHQVVHDEILREAKDLCQVDFDQEVVDGRSPP